MDEFINKGLAKRDQKRLKNQKKMRTIMLAEENICRFIEFRCEEFKRVNGKMNHTGHYFGKGLQIKEKCYLEDGKYKFVKSSGFRIAKIIEGVPNWANEYLVNLYKSKKPKQDDAE